MPNWCYNQFTVTHDEPQMLERFVKAVHDGNLFDEFIPMPEELKETTAPSRTTNEQLIEKYGHDNWYSWSVDNWGTKWDISSGSAELNGDHASGSFSTAWSPPIQAFEALSELGFDINVMYDEESMAFLGTYSSINGDDYYEYPDFENPEWRTGIENSDVLAMLEERYDMWLEEQQELELIELEQQLDQLDEEDNNE
jgi:hypothetical protein